LYDALLLGVSKLDEMGGSAPRFLFIISDGDDNQSRHTRGETIEALLASRTHLVAVSPNAGQGTERGHNTLEIMAAASGGLALDTWSAKDEAGALKKNQKSFDELSQLFHSWNRVQFEVPADVRTPLKLKATAGCKLVAPAAVLPRQ
jgi:hypothetical protein